MEELTIIEKAKAYDKVVNKLKGFMIQGVDPLITRADVQDFFPELIESDESEGEKIRKDIVFYIAAHHKDDGEKARWLYWLEKQGWEKPSDKFEIGDLITNGILVGKIDEIHEWGYHAYFGDHYADVPDIENWHKWTIKDAKDGDVLEFGDHGRLVVGIVSYVNKRTGKVDVNCLLENNKFKVGNFYNLDTIKPHPATKKQRDTLIKAMADSGYTFDFEKKELKKIEQKPAWSEEDEARFESCIKLLQTSDGYNTINTKWLKSLKGRYAWRPSEEQIYSLDRALRFYGKGTAVYDSVKELLEQLKKLKE